MKNELEIFKNEEFGEIRTLLINDKPYFYANDVAKALGYIKPYNAISTHCRATLKQGIPISGKIQDVNFIPEGDVYRLIMKSKLSSAEKFESWVFDEVLPTIRKTGGYINNVDLMVNTYFSDIPDKQKSLVKGLLVNIEEKQKKIISLTNENDLLIQKNLKWADRPLINSLVRAYASSVGDFGKAWNNFKKELLYKYGINLYAKTFKQAGLRTIEERDNSNNETFGVTLATISEFTPEEFYKDKKLYEDWDELGDYYDRHICRSMENLMFDKNVRDKEFFVSDGEDDENDE